MKLKGLIYAVSISLFLLTYCSSPDCANNKYEYQEGYDSGKLTRIMGGYGSCSEYVRSHNSQTGRTRLKATKCFCAGFKDGLNGKSAKY